MAFKRRKFRRFNNGGRRRKARRSFKRFARIAKRVIRRTTEIKRAVITGSTTVTGIQTIQLISPNIPQGLDKDNRIGNKIMYKFMSLKVSAYAVNNQAGGTGPVMNNVRIALISARVGGLTAANTIDEGVSTTPSIGTMGIPLRSENVFVMKDKQFLLPGLYAATDANSSSAFNMPVAKIFNWSRRMPRNITFNDSTASGTTVPRGLIYLYIANTNVQSSVNVIWSGRMSYIDI